MVGFVCTMFNALTWKVARKLKVKGPNTKYPKAAPRKKKNETQNMINCVPFNSFGLSAGFTKRQNSQKIYGNAANMPPINAMEKLLKNWPPNVVVCMLMFTGGRQSLLPRLSL